MINGRIDELKEGLIENTVRILKIKSVEGEAKEGMPFGEGPDKALKEALKISEELGFKTKNLDGYVGYAEYGEGEDYIAVLGHLDVVPEGDGWKYPPYGAEIHEGKIYARGTMDDKGPIMAALYGMKAIKDLNLPLSKRIRIIFGTNEETGSNDIPYYLSKENPPVLGFTPDAEFPIINGEKGIAGIEVLKKLNSSNEDIVLKSIKGGEARNIVPNLCEVVLLCKDVEEVNNKLLELKNSGFNMDYVIEENKAIIKTQGVSAHGSTPHKGKNAIMEMVILLNELNLKGELKEWIQFMVNGIGKEIHGESLGIGFSDDPSGKLTLNVGIVNGNEEEIKFVFDIRFPVTYNTASVTKVLDEKFKAINMEVKHVAGCEPLYYPDNHPLVEKLLGVYNTVTGRSENPIVIGGGTYAKSMPNTLAFGPTFPGKPDVIHGVDEYVEVDDLILMAKIYGNAIYDLAK